MRGPLGVSLPPAVARAHPPARLAPLTAGTADALGPKPVRDNLHHPCVVQRRVKTPPVGIASPVAVTLFTPHRARLHRGVRAAAGAGTGRDPEKFWLGDGVEPRDRRPRDACVFQRRRADGPLAPLSLGAGARRARGSWGRSPLAPLRPGPQVGGALLAVRGPCRASPPGAAACVRLYDASRRRSLEETGGHSAGTRFPRSLAACRPRASACDRAARRGVRTLLGGPALPWARALPATPAAVSAWAGACRLAQGALVRSLLWDSGTVRLPVAVHHDRVRGVHRAARGAIDPGRHRASRGPPPRWPCRPGGGDPARCGDAWPERRARCGLPRVRSAAAPRTRPMSGLSTLPARSPVHASRSSVPRLAQDSGPAGWAQPSLSETSTPSHCAGLSRHTRTLRFRRGEERERGTSGRCSPSPASAL